MANFIEKQAIQDIGDLIAKYRDLPGVEFEFRLGRTNGPKFYSNIGVQNFKKINTVLSTGGKWGNIQTSEVMDYFKQGNNRRDTFSEQTEEFISMEKKRICNITYRVPDFPLDFRFSVSQETNLGDVEPMDDCDFTREKKRISRQYKNWQFDTTQVEGDINMDADDESTVHYEVELEVNDATKLNKDVHWEAHSGILKIMDMLKMCN